MSRAHASRGPCGIVLVTRAPHAEALKQRVMKQRGKESKISESEV
jgi:hypothetical protein